jgi:endonuclease/exonuclease/phosphatase family metal-dependent hydrolase
MGDEQYGNAVLTAFPSRVVRAENLPGIAWLPNLEPRSALWVEIHAGEVQLQLFNTHLGLTPMERHIQTQALLGRRWMNGTHHTGPKILAGDFNVVQGSSTYARLTAHLKDSRTMAGFATSSATYPSAWPRVGIDHIFVDHSLSVTSLRAMTTPLCRIASDHLPLLAEISVSPR